MVLSALQQDRGAEKRGGAEGRGRGGGRTEASSASNTRRTARTMMPASSESERRLPSSLRDPSIVYVLPVPVCGEAGDDALLRKRPLNPLPSRPPTWPYAKTVHE